jgi:hypothetical protein
MLLILHRIRIVSLLPFFLKKKIRAEELETALMEMVKHDNRRSLTAQVNINVAKTIPATLFPLLSQFQ